jgi:hypothetical protein
MPSLSLGRAAKLARLDVLVEIHAQSILSDILEVTGESLDAYLTRQFLTN